MTEDRHGIPPRHRGPADPEEAAVWRRMDRIKLLFEWSLAMQKAGHMPPHVEKAFFEHYGDEARFPANDESPFSL